MSKYSNTIEYMIKTTVDKSGLANLQTEIGRILSQLKELSAQKLVNTSDVNKSIETVQKFQKALDASFNTKLGMLDVSKLNTQLKESQISLGSLQKSFSVAGASGDKAFASVLGQLGKIDTGIKNTSSLMDKLANTMGNTIRWGIMSSAFNGVTDAMRQAVEYAKDLDNSLTQIMLVTDYSRDSMIDYAKQANEAAKSLGATTTAMTNATLVFAQQGFDLDKSGQLAELSTKLANASQQDTSATSDQITAYMNAYGLDGDMEALSKALDSWAKVANISAADVSELAQASQKAASAAATLGVTTDQLNAQIATIESVTREAPEQIGNGLKTLYARFSDLQMGETLEDGIDLGTVTNMLKKIGVEVLDGDGKMRGVGSIMEDLMGVWSSIDSTQKAAVAQALAGKYQLSRFEALMNRSDLYNEYKSGSENASGTLDVMNDKYVDSLQGKLTKLQATFEDILNGLGDSSEFYGFIDGLASALDLVDKLIDAIGGGSAALTAFGAIATKVFSKQMASGLNNMLQNLSVDKKRAENDKIKQQVLTEAGLQGVKGDKVSSITSLIDSSFKYKDVMNKKDVEDFDTNLDNTVEAVQGVISAEEELAQKVEATNLVMADYVKIGEKAIKLTKDENGALQAKGSKDYYDAMYNPDFQKAVGSNSKDFTKKMNTIEANANYLQRNYINDAVEGLTALNEKGSTSGKAIDSVSIKLKNLTGYAKMFISQIRGKDVTDTIYDKLEKEDYNAILDPTDKIIVKMRELLKLSEGEQGENFIAALRDGKVELNDIIALMNELQKNVGKVQTAANNAKNGKFMKGSDDVEKGNNDVDQAERILRIREGINGDQVEGLGRKQDIKDIIDTASAVGDLAFAWQSFQSLGGIFVNADLTAGEKVEQTVLNLSMTVPSLVSSVDVLSKAFKALGIASNVSLGAIGAITAAISLAIVAFSAYSEANKVAFEQEQNNLKSIQESIDSIRQNIDSFNELYDAYRDTGEASAEFISKSKELVDSLGDESDKALLASESYDALAESIRKKQDVQLQDAINEAKRSNNGGAVGKSLDGHGLTNGSIQHDAFSNYEKATRSLGTSYKDVSPFLNNMMSGDWSSRSPEEIIKDTTENIGILQDQLDALGSSYDEYKAKTKDNAISEDAWNKKTQELTDTQEVFQQLLNQDDLAQYATNLKNIAEDTAQLSNFQDSLKGKDSAKEIEDVFNSNSDIAKYLSTIPEKSKQLQFMIDNVSDSTQKMILAGKQAEEQAYELAKKNTGDESLAKEVKKQIESSGLSSEQKVKLVATLDKDTSFENFSQVIQDFKNSPDSVVPLKATIDEDGLKESIENKSNLQDKLVSTYQKNGSFTEDEVANIVEDNPDYLQYLTKVGDKYVLNTNALLDWNNAAKEQTAEIEDAQGKFNSHFFDGYQENLENSVLTLKTLSEKAQEIEQEKGLDNSESSALSSMGNFGQQVQEASQALEDGQISIQDYFQTYQDAYESNNVADIFNNIQDYSEGTQQTILELAETIQKGLSDGLNQANKQLKNGQMSLTDYNKIARTAAKTALEYQASLEGLKKSGKKWIQTVDEEGDGVENLSDKQKDFVKGTKDVEEAIENSDAVSGMAQTLTDNYDYLQSIVDEAGNLKPNISWDSLLGTQQFQSTVDSMADSISSYIQSSDANLQTFAASMGMTSSELVEKIGTDHGSIANWLAADQGNFTSGLQGMMSTSGSAIGQMGASASQIISALGEMIGNFQAEIKTSTKTEIGKTTKTFDIFGLKVEVPWPKITSKTTIKGALTGGGAKKLTAGLKGLSNGLNSLTSMQGAMSNVGLSDFAPSGSNSRVASPSKFNNPGGSGGGGRGGGGRGGGGRGGGGRGGGGRGGGGKGGGGSSYTPKQKDLIEDEIDRYEKVETKLSAIDNDYKKLNKEQERLTGKELAENLAKQNELLQKQIKLYQEKIEIQKEEAKELKGQLSSGYGVTFDEEGFISNYKQVHQKLINDVNNLINQYNSATTESAQNALEDQIESAQKRLDKFKDLYKRYDTLVSDDLKDSIQQIEDLNDSIEDLNISIFQKQLDAADNIKDLHEMIFELNHALHSSIIDDNPFDNFEDHLKELGLYFNDTTMDVNEFYDNLAAKQKEILNNSKSTDAQKKAAQAQLEEIEKVRLEELNGSHTLNPLGTGYLDMALKDTSDISEQIRQFEETGSSEIFGKNSAEMYSVSKDILKKDIDLMTGLKDKVKEVHDDVMDMIDEISDAMDRRAAEYDAINDELEHQLNIIEMIHGDEAYAEMNKVLDVQSAAYKGQLDDLNKQKDIWQKMLDDIGERTEDNKEEWDEVHDKILDTTSQINDLVESSLETLQKKYSNTVANLTKSWSSSMFGGADLDWMNTEWELINRNADYYLDSTNKAYNIQKLQSKYLDLLDGTNDLNIQRKITDQMGQQLGYLRDKTKLSEYDVQYANAQLEILQKQIALEEAQRNKSQMKLRRDTQGNYSYVYAANDDNVRSAQSDLLDAQNNAYNLSKDQMKRTQADSLSALQDAKSQVDDIWNNANISLEEKKKRTQTIIDSLKEYLAGTSEQLSTSEKNIIQDFIGMCDLLTDENKTGIEDIQNQIIQGNNDAFDQIDTRWATSFTGWLNNLQEFNNNTTAMFDKLVENAKNFDDSVKDLSETSKTNFTDISGSVKGVTDAYNKLNASQNEFLSNLANMSGSVEKGEEALRQYKEEITSLDNQMSVLTKQMQTLTDKNQALERENRELRASAAAAANGSGAGGSGSGANGGAVGAGSSAASDERLAKRIANSIWMYGDWGTGRTRGNNITKRFSRRIADLVQSYFNGSPAYGYQYRDYSLGFERFDTGGYTGSWYDGGLDSKDGKLALLHQKELILNATDTENILAAVEAVRAFTDNVKTSLLSNLSTAALSKYAATNSNPQDVNQNIHITAEFPAANSASEIEEALMSLNDRAIQYAFKTK